MLIGVGCACAAVWGVIGLSGCESDAGKPQEAVVVTQKIPPGKAGATGGKPAAPVSEPAAPKAPAAAPEKTKPATGAPADPQKPQGGAMVSLLNLFKGEKAPAHDAHMALYDPKGKIDPFKPLFGEVLKVKRKRRKPTRPLTPLERVDLSQLQLVAVIMAPSGNRALVKEASGKGYIVKKNTRIGINSGRVTRILKSSLMVKEEMEDNEGKTHFKHREMKLQKPPGE